MTQGAPEDVATLLRWYRDGETSPVDVIGACLAETEESQPRLNAFRTVDTDAAVAQAHDSDLRWRAHRPCGRLDGVPVGVKDTIDVAGLSTWSGSLTTSREAAERDSPAVQRLRAEGAILLGKTTTPEFGWKPLTESPATGITRNPHDISTTPGGSSGGSAVAVATGMSLLALGSDGGGSIRIPAAFTGTVGLKPSHGRVPVWPASVLPALTHVGPITRTTADAALMLDVLGGPHPLDWTSAPPQHAYASIVEHGVRGLRVGVAVSAPGCPVAPVVADAARRAGQVLTDCGADVSMVDLPFANPAVVFDTLWFAGMAYRLNAVPVRLRGLVDEDLRARSAGASERPCADLLRAHSAVMDLRQTMGRFHQAFDLLVTPTVPTPAFGVDLAAPPGTDLSSWTSWTGFSYPFNLTQQPAISVPFGVTDSHLPLGVQVAAAKHHDDLVIRAGRALEAAATVHDISEVYGD